LQAALIALNGHEAKVEHESAITRNQLASAWGLDVGADAAFFMFFRNMPILRFVWGGT
jgi:hypothetical protein